MSGTPGSRTTRAVRGAHALLRPHVVTPGGEHRHRRGLDGHLAARSVYGAIVVLGLLLALEDHSPGPFRSAIVVAGTVLGVLAAEAYSENLGREIDLRRATTGAERMASLRQLGAVTVAAEPPVLFLVLAGLGVISEETAFALAGWAALGLLFAYGYLAARNAGRSRWAALWSAAVVEAVGVAVALLKAVAHP